MISETLPKLPSTYKTKFSRCNLDNLAAEQQLRQKRDVESGLVAFDHKAHVPYSFMCAR